MSPIARASGREAFPVPAPLAGEPES